MELINKINGFTIFGLDIKFYGIIIAAAMLIGVFLACKNGKLRNINNDDIVTLALYVLPLAVIGARAYYVIFSSQSYTFLELFEIWNGGLAIYGGVIGGALGVSLFCLIHKKNFWNIADISTISLILGQAIGRWGNFFNQEAYGSIVSNPSWQWFPFAVFIENSSTWHLATFFYESMWNLLIFVFLFILIRKINIKGIVTCLYFILYGIGRFFIEGLRTDSLFIGSSSIRVSQLLSLILIVVATAFMIYLLVKNKKKSSTQLK